MWCVCDAFKSNSLITQEAIHPFLVLHPFVLLLYFNAPCQFTLLHNLRSHFRFNALWLTAFFYSNPLFMMEILFLVYTFLIYAQFFGTQLWRKTRAGCIVYSYRKRRYID